jgi:hypothetical protein
MKFEETKVDEWKEIADWWAQFEAPWHPSKKRIELYRKLFRKYSPGKKVLVLGATPEIRDMLAQERCDVTLVDQSPIMINAMTSLRKTKSKEKFIISNWMNYRSNQKYDAIFGDNVQNNISKRRWVTFERNIKNLLSKDGVFLNWEGGFYNKKSILSYSSLIKLYRKKPKYFDSFRNNAYLHLKVWCYYINKGGRVDSKKVDKELRKMTDKGLITESEFKKIRQPLMWKGVLLDLKDSRALLGKVFKIVEECIEEDTDLYNDFYRLFVLKAR